LLSHGRWFSPGTPVSSTTKTGRHDIVEILLKVALNTTNQIKSIRFVDIGRIVGLYCLIFLFITSPYSHIKRIKVPNEVFNDSDVVTKYINIIQVKKS
jgi:hypothetical protein